MNSIISEYKTIEIDQSLHGYQDGHRLIDSSISFDTNIKNELLKLSDLSGDRVSEGYKNYLTGFPIKKLNVYALARTWYADEMPRTGCVWTHTLYFKFSDLGKISNLYNILNLFSKPTFNEVNKLSYGKKIIANQSKIKYSDLLGLSDSQIKYSYKILEALYSTNSPIALPSSNSSVLENLVFSIWMLQWADLRSQLSFSTGSIEFRTYFENYFDIQVIPDGNINKIKRENPKTIVIEESDLTNKATERNELNTVIKEFVNNNKMRIYCERYFDKTIIRNQVIKFLQYFNIMMHQKKESEYSDLIRYIATLFPDKNVARKLKANIFFDLRAEYTTKSEQIYNFFEELFITPYYRAFDSRSLKIFLRTEELFSEAPDLNSKLFIYLLNSDSNPLAEEYFRALSELLTIEDVLKLSNKSYKALLLLISYNPKISYDYRVWNIKEELQKELFNLLLDRKTIELFDWEKVLHAIIESNTVIPNEMLKQIDTQVTVNVVLNIINMDERIFSDNSKRIWIEQLNVEPKYIINWIEKNNFIAYQTTEILLSVLNPNDEFLLRNKVFYETFFENDLNKKYRYNEKSLINYHAFKLAAALNNILLSSAEIVAKHFRSVYEAAKDDKLWYESWKYLEKHTQDLGFYNWDKCERLRRCLVDKFISNSWPVEYFIESITGDRKLIKKTLKYLNEIDQSERYLKKLARYLNTSIEQLNDDTDYILRKI